MKDYLVAMFAQRAIIIFGATTLLTYIGHMIVFLRTPPPDIKQFSVWQPTIPQFIIGALVGLVAAGFFAFRSLWEKWHKLDEDRGVPELALSCTRNTNAQTGYVFHIQNVKDRAAFNIMLSSVTITTMPTEIDFEIAAEGRILERKPQQITISFPKVPTVIKGDHCEIEATLSGVGPLLHRDLSNALSGTKDFNPLEGNQFQIVLRFSDADCHDYETDYDLVFTHFDKVIFCRRKGSRTLPKLAAAA